MTKLEIRQTLHNLSKLINKMDKLHLKELLGMLTNNAQAKNDCALFLYMDTKKTVKRLVNELIKANKVDKNCLLNK